MKTTLFALAALALAGCGDNSSPPSAKVAKLTPEQLDASVAPVTSCDFDNMSKVMDGVATISWQQASQMCESLHREFDAMPATNVLRAVGKVSSLVEMEEQDVGNKVDPVAVSKTLGKIIHLRRQTDPVAQRATLETVWKGYKATNGRITPEVIYANLRASGDMAHTLNDDGLISLIAMADVMNRDAN